MNIRRALALLLSVLTVSAMFAACGSSEQPAADGTTAAADTAEADVTSEETTEAVLPAPEAQNYDGATFSVFTSNALGTTESVLLLNYAETITGEIVNDTLFERDRWLEERYNVKTAFTVENTASSSDRINRFKNSVNAGENNWHMILQDQAEVAKNLSLGGFSYPLNYIDSIHLDAEYWMPEMNQECAINGSVYFATSAISPCFYGSAYITLFNRDMANALGYTDIYQDVQSGTWTVDKMAEYARGAVIDSNGDGQIDGQGEDQVGMSSDCFEQLVLSAGFHFVENGGDGLRCCCEDEKLVTYMQKLNALFREEGIYSSMTSDTDALINNGNTLFFVTCSFLLDEYRSLDYDYGILPSPKYDEAQDSYIDFSQPWVNVTPSILITVVGDELEMTGTLTDAMAYYGYTEVREAVLDNVIRYKGARDEESAEIIDLIFENITFELSTQMGFGSLYRTLQQYLCGVTDQDITSLYAGIKDSTEAAIADVISTYAENEAKLS